MNDKKHIDRLFQEKFKDFEAEPSPEIWGNIEARLNNKKKKRRIIPIWWTFGGAAAVLLIYFTINNFIKIDNTNKNTQPIIVKTDTSIIKGEKNNTNTKALISKSKKENVLQNNNSTNYKKASKKILSTTNKLSANKKVSSFQKKLANNNTVLNSNTLNNNKHKPTLVYNIKKGFDTKKTSDSNKSEIKPKNELKEIIQSQKNNAVAQNKINNSAQKDSITNSKIDVKQSIEEAIKIAETLEPEDTEKTKKWSIAPNVAPVYFSSLGQGSSIAAEFTNNTKTTNITMSYGIKGSYKIGNRFKVTAGINRVNFSNSTNDVIALSDNSFASRENNADNFKNLTLKTRINDASLMLVSKPSLNSNSVSEAVNTLKTGNIDQNIGFIEIPLEIEYRLLDKKIGLNLSGGFSTLLLTTNEIFADVNNENTLIGEANNINTTSFSANFGLGLDYGITKKITLNIDPKFKYQLNTFNNTSGDFRPFFIGFYTGISYTF